MLRALRVTSAPGSPAKGRAPPRRLHPPGLALVVLGCAPLLHMRRYVIRPRRAPAPLRFRLLECPREFEQVLLSLLL